VIFIFYPHDGFGFSHETILLKFWRKDMIQFLVHEKADNVGVATVDIKTGELAQGLYMDSQESCEVKTLQDIPLGHKIALADIAADSSVIKYGADIGRVVAQIKAGEHVHTHNLKTRRW
jgi:(2R)-sulfolactate sulfo-lyase subunit alpha